MKNLGQDGNKDTDLLENGLEDTGRGKGNLGQSERVAWTYIHLNFLKTHAQGTRSGDKNLIQIGRAHVWTPVTL